MTQNVHFAKYFVTVDNDGERFLAIVLFHVSTYALFYQAQSNQSQKETNVPYPTLNQTKLAIFTKHSNGNINISCCGCQVVYPRLEWVYWALPRPRLGWFELILQDDRQSRYWNNRNHTVGRLRSSNWIVEGYHQYRHDMEIGRLISVIQC